MSSCKPPPEGKDLPTTPGKTQRKLSILVQFGEKACPTGYLLNNLFFCNPISQYDHFSSNKTVNYYKAQNKIPAFRPKAGEKPMDFQLVQTNSENGLFFQLFQPEWTSGVAPGIFRRGLTRPTRGLKYGFQGTINAKNLRKIAFHLPTGG